MFESDTKCRFTLSCNGIIRRCFCKVTKEVQYACGVQFTKADYLYKYYVSYYLPFAGSHVKEFLCEALEFSFSVRICTLL